jgi:hypothetical protein
LLHWRDGSGSVSTAARTGWDTARQAGAQLTKQKRTAIDDGFKQEEDVGKNAATKLAIAKQELAWISKIYG